MEYFRGLEVDSKQRSLALDKDFLEYRKKLTLLKKIEEKIISMDEEIYGTRGNIITGYLVKSSGFAFPTNYGNLVFNIEKNTITCNEHQHEAYGNGCVLRKEGIITHTFSTKETVFENEGVIITLRRLKKKQEDIIKKMVSDERKKFNSKKNKNDKDTFFLDMNVRSVFDEEIAYKECYKKVYKDSEFEKFVKAVIANIDFVSYYTAAYIQKGISEKNIDDTYSLFMFQLDTLTKIGKMPSNTNFYEELVRWCGYNKGSISPNIESAKMAIKTIESEVEEASKILSSKKEYNDLRSQYETLKNEIIQMEEKFH